MSSTTSPPPKTPKTMQEVIDLWTLEMEFQKDSARSKTLTDEGKRTAFAKWTTIRNMISHLKNLEA